MLVVGYAFITVRPPSTYQEQTYVQTPTELPLYTKVQVQVDAPSCQWNRDPATDLPACQIDLGYSVSNAGTMTANPRVTVSVDSFSRKDDSLTLPAGASDLGSLSISFAYDTTHTVQVSAFAEDSQDSQTIQIDATLPRHPSDVKILQLYVTPNDPEITEVMANILSNPFAASAKWLALSNWVAQNIQYEGSGTYWQLPRETLQKRTGVCKEYSTLLVSLLRAAGYSADDVFVVRGTKVGETAGHVWVRIHLDIIGWQELEPQAGVFGLFVGISEVRSGWTAGQVFNDVSGYVLSSVAMMPIISLGSMTLNPEPITLTHRSQGSLASDPRVLAHIVHIVAHQAGSMTESVGSHGSLCATNHYRVWHRISHSIL
jgi:transglutaminase-like putative cysteine protease